MNKQSTATSETLKAEVIAFSLRVSILGLAQRLVDKYNESRGPPYVV